MMCVWTVEHLVSWVACCCCEGPDLYAAHVYVLDTW